MRKSEFLMLEALKNAPHLNDKTWYNRRTFTLFLLSKRFVVCTSKVLYPQFLYEISFYVRGGGTSK
jgi:hypothetical protein